MRAKKSQTDQEKIKILASELEPVVLTALKPGIPKSEKITIMARVAARGLLRAGRPEMYKKINEQLQFDFLAPAITTASEGES